MTTTVGYRSFSAAGPRLWNNRSPAVFISALTKTESALVPAILPGDHLPRCTKVVLVVLLLHLLYSY